MTLHLRIFTALLALTFFMLMAAGCSSTDKYVNVLYQPSVYAGGGGGNLYLTAAGEGSGSGKASGSKWTIGKVTNRDGNQTGNIVTTVAPVELILDAFTHELTKAGYKTIKAAALPTDVTKGVHIDRAEIKMENVSSLFKDEGSGRLTVSLELWKNGKNFKKLYFESAQSATALRGRDLLLQDILQKTLQGLMEKAVPEIIKELGK